MYITRVIFIVTDILNISAKQVLINHAASLNFIMTQPGWPFSTFFEMVEISKDILHVSLQKQMKIISRQNGFLSSKAHKTSKTLTWKMFNLDDMQHIHDV